jgi:hypothetical protein
MYTSSQSEVSMELKAFHRPRSSERSWPRLRPLRIAGQSIDEEIVRLQDKWDANIFLPASLSVLLASLEWYRCGSTAGTCREPFVLRRTSAFVNLKSVERRGSSPPTSIRARVTKCTPDMFASFRNDNPRRSRCSFSRVTIARRRTRMIRGGAKVFCIDGLVPCVAALTPMPIAYMSDMKLAKHPTPSYLPH